jgi:hypothetical protein
MYCARVAGGFDERYSRYFSYYRCKNKHTCDVVVSTTRICLRDRGFKSHELCREGRMRMTEQEMVTHRTQNVRLPLQP